MTIIKEFTSKTYTINANSYCEGDVPISKVDGYKPIGIIGFSTNYTGVDVTLCRLHNDSLAKMVCTNTRAGTISTNLTVDVLYIKVI